MKLRKHTKINFKPSESTKNFISLVTETKFSTITAREKVSSWSNGSNAVLLPKLLQQGILLGRCLRRVFVGVEQVT